MNGLLFKLDVNTNVMTPMHAGGRKFIEYNISNGPENNLMLYKANGIVIVIDPISEDLFNEVFINAMIKLFHDEIEPIVINRSFAAIGGITAPIIMAWKKQDHGPSAHSRVNQEFRLPTRVAPALATTWNSLAWLQSSPEHPEQVELCAFCPPNAQVEP